ARERIELERVALEDDRLRNQERRGGCRAGPLFDRSADCHDLDEARRELADRELVADDLRGTESLGLLAQDVDTILARAVDEARQLGDLAAPEALDHRADAAHDADRVHA